MVGDNPSCSSGIPVTLDWTFIQWPTEDLDEYLEMKGRHRYKPYQFYMSSQKRLDILTKAGFDRDCLRKAHKVAWMAKAKRRLRNVWVPAETVAKRLSAVV